MCFDCSTSTKSKVISSNFLKKCVTSLRFVYKMEEEEEKRGVHFQEQDIDRHVNDIAVKQTNEKIDIHVGFLQVFHKYEITVDIPLSYLPKSETFVPIVPEIPQPFGR